MECAAGLFGAHVAADVDARALCGRAPQSVHRRRQNWRNKHLRCLAHRIDGTHASAWVLLWGFASFFSSSSLAMQVPPRFAALRRTIVLCAGGVLQRETMPPPPPGKRAPPARPPPGPAAPPAGPGPAAPAGPAPPGPAAPAAPPPGPSAPPGAPSLRTVRGARLRSSKRPRLGAALRNSGDRTTDVAYPTSHCRPPPGHHRCRQAQARRRPHHPPPAARRRRLVGQQPRPSPLRQHPRRLEVLHRRRASLG